MTDKIAGFMIAHGFTTGHGDTLDDLLAEFGAQIDTHRSNYSKRIEERDTLRNALQDLISRFVGLFDGYARKTYAAGSDPDSDLDLALTDARAAVAHTPAPRKAYRRPL